MSFHFNPVSGSFMLPDDVFSSKDIYVIRGVIPVFTPQRDVDGLSCIFERALRLTGSASRPLLEHWLVEEINSGYDIFAEVQARWIQREISNIDPDDDESVHEVTKSMWEVLNARERRPWNNLYVAFKRLVEDIYVDGKLAVNWRMETLEGLTELIEEVRSGVYSGVTIRTTSAARAVRRNNRLEKLKTDAATLTFHQLSTAFFESLPPASVTLNHDIARSADTSSAAPLTFDSPLPTAYLEPVSADSFSPGATMPFDLLSMTYLESLPPDFFVPEAIINPDITMSELCMYDTRARPYDSYNSEVKMQNLNGHDNQNTLYDPRYPQYDSGLQRNISEFNYDFLLNDFV